MVDYLKEQGLYENTVFVYTCDNGWVQHPEKKNASIRSKREPVEAGIRTPIFITHGASIKPRRDREILASNIDIAPTILRLCGMEPPAVMSGLDLRDTAALKQRNRIFVDIYEHDSNLDKLDDPDDGMVARVVIDGWDKLLARPSGKELYDLKSDPDDRNDLSAEYPDKVASLWTLIEEWMEATPAGGGK